MHALTFLIQIVLTFKVACGTQTGSFVTNIDSCASTGGTSRGRNSPKDCWDVCTGVYGDGCNSALVKAIVWKHGTCGCVTVNYENECERPLNGTDFEYYEPGENCVLGNEIFLAVINKTR